MTSLRRIILAAAAAVLAAGAAQAGPATSRPIVVELFTSQGCSSCPPADQLLGRLAQRPNIIAISLPITYWDMLGWKDTLANDANTRRQKAYAAAMGHGGVYTPQIIVDGTTDVVGSRAPSVEVAIAERRAQIEEALMLNQAEYARVALQAAARAQIEVQREVLEAQRAAEAAGVHNVAISVPAPPMPPVPPALPRGIDPMVPVSIRDTPQEMRIDLPAVANVSNATVWMIHLRDAVTVPIGAGENAGHTVTYHNVASDVRAVGVYKGKALTLTLPKAPLAHLPHDGVAVIVQQGGYGHVIGAALVTRPDYYAQQ
jgi:hypothetical protein